MASLSANPFSTASKRSRSQQSSPAPLESPPAPKATKTEDVEKIKIPAFLRQSKAEIYAKFCELNWQEKIRIAQGRGDPESKWIQDTSPQVMQRNRYIGVQPWDRSRIHLRVAEGSSDYINASPISLHDLVTGSETKYIATQGPKKSVLSHFWQMIRHETENVAVIVMLTPTEESGREKCYQYFPLDAESSPFKVQASGREDDRLDGEVSYVETVPSTGPNTVVRKLNLSFGSESKVVWHLLFTAFPDFGVPEDEDRGELIDLIKLSAEKNGNSSNPRIVHCSAGVGRSGTFIALEFLLAQLESGAVARTAEDEDLVQDVVHQLREQRMMMVQMENQFQLLYDVLREEIERKLHQSDSIPGPPSPKFRKLASGLGTSDTGDTASKEARADIVGNDDGLAKVSGKGKEENRDHDQGSSLSANI